MSIKLRFYFFPLVCLLLLFSPLLHADEKSDVLTVNTSLLLTGLDSLGHVIAGAGKETVLRVAGGGANALAGAGGAALSGFQIYQDGKKIKIEEANLDSAFQRNDREAFAKAFAEIQIAALNQKINWVGVGVGVVGTVSGVATMVFGAPTGILAGAGWALTAVSFGITLTSLGWTYADHSDLYDRGRELYDKLKGYQSSIDDAPNGNNICPIPTQPKQTPIGPLQLH